MVRRRDHDLADFIVIALSGMLCGAESCTAMEDFGLAKEGWFRPFPGLRNEWRTVLIGYSMWNRGEIGSGRAASTRRNNWQPYTGCL